jgi:hypothetical protein
MSKQLLVNQPFGIGDAIWAQMIALHFIEQDYSVTWPVAPLFVEGLKRAYPFINWISVDIVKPEIFQTRTDTIVGGYRVIPIRFSDTILGVPAKQWMRAKMDLYGLDWTRWKKAAYYNRTPAKEIALRDHFGIKPGDDYVFVSKKFRTDFTGHISMDLPKDRKWVEMVPIPGYSLFDYSWLIENAAEIHVVNSAIFYLLELLDLKSTSTNIYSRKPDEIGFPYVDYIMTKNYILHQ